jgi:hypothetical protein
MSLPLTLVERDSRVENIRTERRTVIDIMARLNGVHIRIDMGTMRTAAAMKTLRDLVVAEISFWKKSVSTGSTLSSPCLDQRKGHLVIVSSLV